MKKRNKIILFIVIVLLVVGASIFCYFKFVKNDDNVNKVTNVEEIDEFGYTLKSNATETYEIEYEILKTNLKSTDINEEEYVKSVAKLFIIDLYTINNKINKYDVGGTEFVYPDSLENYKVNVEDTLYKYVEDNSNNNRTQSLPEVSDVQITDFKKVKYKVSDTELDAYEVALKWSYVVDMDYESEGSVIILQKDNKYYVVEKK
jgi:hypothetical protein